MSEIIQPQGQLKIQSMTYSMYVVVTDGIIIESRKSCCTNV